MTRRRKSNTTNSVYTLSDARGTVLHPASRAGDVDEVLFSLACYMHDRLVSGEQHLRVQQEQGLPLPPSFCDDGGGLPAVRSGGADDDDDSSDGGDLPTVADADAARAAAAKTAAKPADATPADSAAAGVDISSTADGATGEAELDSTAPPAAAPTATDSVAAADSVATADSADSVDATTAATPPPPPPPPDPTTTAAVTAAVTAAAAAAATTSEIPDENEIFDFLSQMYHNSDYSAQCLVVALVYIERLFVQGRVPPLRGNWKRVLFTALVLAAKVWDDQGSSNGEFAKAIAIFSVQQVNRMESRFLELIQYNVTVTRKLYTTCYFELRELCEHEEESFPLRPLAISEVDELEDRSALFTKYTRARSKSMYATQGHPSLAANAVMAATSAGVFARGAIYHDPTGPRTPRDRYVTH